MKTIACLGSGSGKAGDPGYDAMVQAGRILANRGFAVITGGLGGTGMEAPARGAKEAGGTTIGYTMLGQKPNQWITQIGDCAAQYHIGFTAPPIPEIQYGMRIGSLLAASGFIVAAGGGPGTMVELMAIINLNFKLWKLWQDKKRFAVLKLNAESGWGDEMFDQLETWGVLPPAVRELAFVAQTPEQAVSWVIWQPDE